MSNKKIPTISELDWLIPVESSELETLSNFGRVYNHQDNIYYDTGDAVYELVGLHPKGDVTTYYLKRLEFSCSINDTRNEQVTDLLTGNSPEVCEIPLTFESEEQIKLNKELSSFNPGFYIKKEKKEYDLVDGDILYIKNLTVYPLRFDETRDLDGEIRKKEYLLDISYPIGKFPVDMEALKKYQYLGYKHLFNRDNSKEIKKIIEELVNEEILKELQEEQPENKS